MIIIVDYGMGNLNSVKRKFNRIGVNATISSNPKELANADKLILPGVGHFYNAIKNIKQLQLWDVLNEMVLVRKKPVLGICLGMQLMAKHSEEGEAQGFAWIDASVIKFNVKDKLKFKVPHVGWNQIHIQKASNLITNLPDLSEFYFVHAYYIKCNVPEDILCETAYESTFTSAVEKENIFGVQFHPEKSHDVGEQLLKKFTEL